MSKRGTFYLGLSKSSGGGSVFPYKSILKKFFYQSIERLSLYLSMLFDQYPNTVKVIKFS